MILLPLNLSANKSIPQSIGFKIPFHLHRPLMVIVLDRTKSGDDATLSTLNSSLTTEWPTLLRLQCRLSCLGHSPQILGDSTRGLTRNDRVKAEALKNPEEQTIKLIFRKTKSKMLIHICTNNVWFFIENKNLTDCSRSRSLGPASSTCPSSSPLLQLSSPTAVIYSFLKNRTNIAEFEIDLVVEIPPVRVTFLSAFLLGASRRYY